MSNEGKIHGTLQDNAYLEVNNFIEALCQLKLSHYFVARLSHIQTRKNKVIYGWFLEIKDSNLKDIYDNLNHMLNTMNANYADRRDLRALDFLREHLWMEKVFQALQNQASFPLTISREILAMCVATLADMGAIRNQRANGQVYSRELYFQTRNNMDNVSLEHHILRNLIGRPGNKFFIEGEALRQAQCGLNSQQFPADRFLTLSYSYSENNTAVVDNNSSSNCARCGFVNSDPVVRQVQVHLTLFLT